MTAYNENKVEAAALVEVTEAPVADDSAKELTSEELTQAEAPEATQATEGDASDQAEEKDPSES